jgi:hypothetical protein
VSFTKPISLWFNHLSIVIEGQASYIWRGQTKPPSELQSQHWQRNLKLLHIAQWPSLSYYTIRRPFIKQAKGAFNDYIWMLFLRYRYHEKYGKSPNFRNWPTVKAQAKRMPQWETWDQVPGPADGSSLSFGFLFIFVLLVLVQSLALYTFLNKEFELTFGGWSRLFLPEWSCRKSLQERPA